MQHATWYHATCNMQRWYHATCNMQPVQHRPHSEKYVHTAEISDARGSPLWCNMVPWYQRTKSSHIETSPNSGNFRHSRLPTPTVQHGQHSLVAGSPPQNSKLQHATCCNIHVATSSTQ